MSQEEIDRELIWDCIWQISENVLLLYKMFWDSANEILAYIGETDEEQRKFQHQHIDNLKRLYADKEDIMRRINSIGSSGRKANRLDNNKLCISTKLQ